jgi:hypothetical protein
MWRQLLGALVVVWGLTGSTYLAWCQHRVSFPVLMHDSAWPRPSPYPDRWLARWYDRINAANPVPPGHVKMEGEWYELQARLRAYTLLPVVVIALGVAISLWPPTGRRSARWPSVRRGVAIGLVIGVAWAAFIAHHINFNEVSSFWCSFAVFAIGFVIVGAAVGGVRHFPELVGLGAGFVALAALAARMARDIDINFSSSFGSDLPMTATDFVNTLADVDWRLGWLVVFGGSGLLCGPIIGALYRTFRPAKDT